MGEEKRPTTSIAIKVCSAFAKLLFVVVLIAFLVFIYGYNDAKDVPIEDVDTALIENTAVNELKSCGARELKQFIGLESEQYDSFIYYKSVEPLGVDEVLVVKVKDKSETTVVQDAIDARIKEQISVFDGYGPAQVKLLKNAMVTTKGKYVFYCVGPNPVEYEEVFKNVIQ